MDYKTFAERYRSLGRGDTGTDEVVIRGTLALPVWTLNITYAPKEE